MLNKEFLKINQEAFSSLIQVGRFFFDDFVKSPSAALRCILRHCGVTTSTPHSSGFARLAYEAFYEAVCC
jgi:hypothetical protein